MTVALCTNCGELKHGAWCACPNCNAEAFDGEISILLSDHNLSERELRQIGDAVRKIRSTGLDEETRFHVLLYFLSRKWPKLLEYDVDAAEPHVQRVLDTVYRSLLANIAGQEDPRLKVSPIRERTWTRAMGADLQREEDAWQSEARDVLMNGMNVAKRIVALGVAAGEGAVLQKFAHALRSLFQGCDYRRLAATAVELIGDAKEHRREVEAFCSRVKNGWSDRTKEQAAYFRGTCQRLEEMAERTKTIIEHKAGITVLIRIDFKRARQEFEQSYRTFLNLSYVVLEPSRIHPDGTCEPRW